jgi:hypothetical protein
LLCAVGVGMVVGFGTVVMGRALVDAGGIAREVRSP